jgi:cytochrome P450
MSTSIEPNPTAAPWTGAPREIPRLDFRWVLQRLADPERERRDMLGGLVQAYQKHGDVVGMRVPGFQMVHLFGPDANRKVLLDQEGIFSARKPWMQIMGRIFPNGLLLLDGAQHKRDRKIMKNAFTRPALRQYAGRMNCSSCDLI